MADEFDLEIGRFRAIADKFVAFEPAGVNLVQFAGETLIIELKPGVSSDEGKELAQLLNKLAGRVSIRDLG